MKMRSACLSAVVAVAAVIYMAALVVAAEPAAAVTPIKGIPKQGVKSRAKLKLDQSTKGAARWAVIQKNSPGTSNVGIYATDDSILRGSGDLVTKAQPGESLEARGDRYGMVLGAYFRKGYEQQREGFAKGRYLIFGNEGTPKLEITGIDGTMSIQPSPNAAFVLGWYGLNSPGAFPTFFYGGGKKKKAESWPAEHHINGVTFSPDGSLVGIGVSGQNGARTHTSFYDAQARKTWDAPAVAVAFSADGKQIALVMADKVEIRDKNGEALREIPISGLNVSSKVEFSGDGKRLAVTTSGNGLRIVSVESGKITGSWDWTTSESIRMLAGSVQFQVVGLSASQDGTSLGVAGITWHMKPVKLEGWGEVERPENLADLIIILDEKGKIKDEIVLPPGMLLKSTEAPVVVSADGKSVTVPTVSKILRYDVVN